LSVHYFKKPYCNRSRQRYSTWRLPAWVNTNQFSWLNAEEQSSFGLQLAKIPLIKIDTNIAPFLHFYSSLIFSFEQTVLNVYKSQCPIKKPIYKDTQGQLCIYDLWKILPCGSLGNLDNCLFCQGLHWKVDWLLSEECFTFMIFLSLPPTQETFSLLTVSIITLYVSQVSLQNFSNRYHGKIGSKIKVKKSM
jgi:hypothetical protein